MPFLLLHAKGEYWHSQVPLATSSFPSVSRECWISAYANFLIQPPPLQQPTRAPVSTLTVCLISLPQISDILGQNSLMNMGWVGHSGGKQWNALHANTITCTQGLTYQNTSTPTILIAFPWGWWNKYYSKLQMRKQAGRVGTTSKSHNCLHDKKN